VVYFGSWTIGIRMIESSFCFLPGVGPKIEHRLWQDGITTWAEFLSYDSIEGIGRARKALYNDSLVQAQNRRAAEDARYFGVALRRRDHWRLYEWLRSRALYLDIETDSFGQITIVGLYGRGQFTPLIRGESLDHRRLRDELVHYDLLATFCGATFDLPRLLASYPDLPLDHPHIDLCFLGKQLGYHGGLKSIEAQLGISRVSRVEGLDGSDAVVLWNRWRHRRDSDARERLVAYNHADCVNLEPLAERFYAAMTDVVMGDVLWKHHKESRAF